MGQSQAFNLSTWLRRLGFKRADEPELLYSVQPVQVVSDAHGLTPPLLGPMAGYGGVYPAIAGASSVLVVRAAAPVLVEHLVASITDVTGSGMFYRIIPGAPPAFAAPGPFACTPQIMSERPDSLVQIGAMVVAAALEPRILPISIVGAEAHVNGFPPIHVPQGSTLIVGTEQVNTLADWSMRLREFAPDRGP